MAATAATSSSAALCFFNGIKTHSLSEPSPSLFISWLQSPTASSQVPTKPFPSFKTLHLHAPLLSTSPFKFFSVLQETASLPSQEEKDDEEQDPKQRDSSPPVPTTKLYVCGLPFGLDDAEVREMFQQCGKVNSVELIRDKVTGRSRGFAFVTMSTVEEAEAAIQKIHKYELSGRAIDVSFANSTRLFPDRRSNDPDLDNYVDSPHRIYCGNLAWTVTSRSLGDFFSANGNVLGAKVMYDPQSGRSLGYGFVSFASKGDVKAAFTALNGKDLQGRPVQINRVRRVRRSTTKDSSAIKESPVTEDSSTTEENSEE
uniref:TSA: Wollemia nobilis Ref_Wollemi_Transcript_5411_1134 transcribed RNA sequence n=1 Tax=Wollemia nobilis TaxID=56998 RepID=A0A0C9S888_9CONI